MTFAGTEGYVESACCPLNWTWVRYSGMRLRRDVCMAIRRDGKGCSVVVLSEPRGSRIELEAGAGGV